MPIVRDIQLPPLPVDLPEFLAAIEEAYIHEALSIAADKKEAAALIGLRRTTLVEKLKRRDTVSRRNTGRSGRHAGGI